MPADVILLAALAALMLGSGLVAALAPMAAPRAAVVRTGTR